MNRFLASAFCLLLSVAASGEVLHWTIDGVDRQALVYAPDHPRAKSPVIFVFHGHGGTMQNAALHMRFHQAWPEAIVVYPQGLPTVTPVDPQGVRPGWQREPGQVGDRDLKFFDAVLDTLHSKYRVDDRRIYATGFSNGGIFSFLLWGERGKTLAAVGICASFLLPSVSITTPRPVIHIAGEADHTAKFENQVESMQAERDIDGCSASGQPCGSGCTRYESVKHAPVVNIIHSGGHVYPPWATDEIVRFFKRQTR
ncbi:MAG TPA: alpha/beta hydrolase-fold protein [Thermoanaerobaculia bacterium]|nr:alpha/beta hydrolase-fold protein [Thermoanaerobaculia bacterium]